MHACDTSTTPPCPESDLIQCNAYWRPWHCNHTFAHHYTTGLARPWCLLKPHGGTHEHKPSWIACSHVSVAQGRADARTAVLESRPATRTLTSSDCSDRSPALALRSSMDVGLTHIVSLCNYAEFGPGTPQYNFFIQDMANINRVMTPWIIIMFHAPV